MRVLFFIFCSFFFSVAAQTPKGHLILNGGGKKPAVVMQQFIDLAGGKDALIVVIPSASELRDTGEYYKNLFESEYGCSRVVPLEIWQRGDAANTDYAELTKKAGGIFFAGGDQRRLTAYLLDTAVGHAVASAYERGAVLGGTSAGTACMSKLMITGDGDFTTIRAENVVLTPGFGYFQGVIVDQHFIARGRQNRLMTTVLEHPQYLGVGIDEATAAWVKPDGTMEVIGEGWVQIYDAEKTKIHKKENQGHLHLGAHNLVVHLLQPGEIYDLKTRQIMENK